MRVLQRTFQVKLKLHCPLIYEFAARYTHATTPHALESEQRTEGQEWKAWDVSALAAREARMCHVGCPRNKNITTNGMKGDVIIAARCLARENRRLISRDDREMSLRSAGITPRPETLRPPPDSHARLHPSRRECKGCLRRVMTRREN